MRLAIMQPADRAVGALMMLQLDHHVVPGAVEVAAPPYACLAMLRRHTAPAEVVGLHQIAVGLMPVATTALGALG
jgi:hypothetical protein